MLDEAFLPLHETLALMLALPDEMVDGQAGVRSHIVECELESPVELDLARGADGQLVIGSVPPLYRVDTTLRPVFHRLTFTAVLEELTSGG